MALVPCRECRREISTEAVTCPHCGVPHPVTQPQDATQPAASSFFRRPPMPPTTGSPSRPAPKEEPTSRAKRDETVAAGGPDRRSPTRGLKPCKTCHQEVSTSAKRCPHCGQKYPTGGLTLPVKVALGVIALVGIGQLVATFGGSSSRSPGPTPPPTREVAVAVSSEQLFADYHDNEVAADSKYKGHVLHLTGFVDSINKDFLDKTYLMLNGTDMYMGVRAQLKSSEVARAAGLSKGEAVQLVCKGTGMVIGAPTADECVFR